MTRLGQLWVARSGNKTDASQVSGLLAHIVYVCYAAEAKSSRPVVADRRRSYRLTIKGDR
jgi:hypothetical protein